MATLHTNVKEHARACGDFLDFCLEGSHDEIFPAQAQTKLAGEDDTHWFFEVSDLHPTEDSEPISLNLEKAK